MLSCIFLVWLFDVIFFISVLVCNHCCDPVRLLFDTDQIFFFSFRNGVTFVSWRMRIRLLFSYVVVLDYLCCVVRSASLRGAAAALRCVVLCGASPLLPLSLHWTVHSLESLFVSFNCWDVAFSSPINFFFYSFILKCNTPMGVKSYAEWRGKFWSIFEVKTYVHFL